MVQPGRTPNALMSPEDAVEIGYEVGRNLRLAGAGKALEKRSLRRWLGEKVDNPAFVFWRKGFRCGYRGLPKPQ
jgi:hypothetical protein